MERLRLHSLKDSIANTARNPNLESTNQGKRKDDSIYFLKTVIRPQGIAVFGLSKPFLTFPKDFIRQAGYIVQD